MSFAMHGMAIVSRPSNNRDAYGQETLFLCLKWRKTELPLNCYDAPYERFGGNSSSYVQQTYM